jgi:hypothetical protein
MADGYIDRNPVSAGQPQPPAPSGTDLAALKRMFTEAQDMTQTARTEALRDLDYYDGDQWTRAERAALAKRKQPDIVINRIKAAVNGIIGVSERGKSEPRAFPRTPNDEGTADVATDVLRFIADHARFHRLKQDAFFDMLVPGSMAVLIGVDADMQVEPVQIRWEELFADPRSRRRDFKDARYIGVAKWMYADDVAALYPDKKADEIEGSVASPGVGVPDFSFQDRPNDATVVWNDAKRRRLLVVEIYYREGVWQRCVFIGSCKLEEGPSPYLDHKGRPDCPIEAQSAYVDRNNARYGVVRDMRGPQDEINKRRSKLLHLLSVSQVQVSKDAFAGLAEGSAELARAEAARPDGAIPAGWEKVSTAEMARGQLELLAESKSEMERMGPNPAILGRQGEDQSGRALLARQQAGLVELALLYGGLEDWELRVYRQMWARAKQFWREPMYIRVLDDEDAPRFVGLNGAPPAPQPQQPGQPPGMAQPQQPQTAGQPNVLGYKNALAEMDVDIILDTTPDQGTVAQEQFNEVMRLLSSNPVWAQQLTLVDALELSAIPHKRSLVARLKEREQQAQQVQGAAAQLAAQQAEATVEKTKAETDLTGAKAANEMMKPHVDAVQAFETAAQTPPPGAPQGDTGGAPTSAPAGIPPQADAGPPPFG